MSMLNMRSSRLWCLNRAPIFYSKVQTSTNNPQISAKMRYSQIVNSGVNRTTVKGAPIQRTVVPLTN